LLNTVAHWRRRRAGSAGRQWRRCPLPHLMQLPFFRGRSWIRNRAAVRTCGRPPLRPRWPETAPLRSLAGARSGSPRQRQPPRSAGTANDHAGRRCASESLPFLPAVTPPWRAGAHKWQSSWHGG
jgi:hypothetical protein